MKGAGYALSGLRWLPKSGLRRFVALPLLINIVMFGAGVAWSYGQFEQFDQTLQGWLPTWLNWLHWLIWPLFALTVLVALFYGFSVMTNLLAAPFNSLLAAQVAQQVGPARPPRPAPSPVWKELLLSPLAVINKLLYFIGWALPLVPLSLIPAVNMAAPPLWILFGAWMLALEYADYPLSNRGLSFRDQRRLLRRHWPLALGFGSVVLLLTLIPLVNFLAMPAAVIGATLMWTQEVPE